MKSLLFSIFFICSAFVGMAQKGVILGAGVSHSNLELSNDTILLKTLEFQNVLVHFEWQSESPFTMGAEFHYCIDEKIKFWEARVKLGVILLKNHRVQIPVYPYFGMFRASEDEGPKYGNTTMGILGGIRLYITNNLSLQGTYDTNFNIVNVVDDKEITDALGNIYRSSLSISLNYYFSGYDY